MYVNILKISHNVRKIPLEFNSSYTLKLSCEPTGHLHSREMVRQCRFDLTFPVKWCACSLAKYITSQLELDCFLSFLLSINYLLLFTINYGRTHSLLVLVTNWRSYLRRPQQHKTPARTMHYTDNAWGRSWDGVSLKLLYQHMPFGVNVAVLTTVANCS